MGKLLKRTCIGIISVLAVIGLIIGGYQLKQQAEYNEMVRIVKSEEVKAIIEEDLNDIHEGALKEIVFIHIKLTKSRLDIIQWEELCFVFF